jgi:hypothetical protein
MSSSDGWVSINESLLYIYIYITIIPYCVATSTKLSNALATTVVCTVDGDLAISKNIDYFLNIRADSRRLFDLVGLPARLDYPSLDSMVFSVLASGSDDAGKNFMVMKR